MKLTTAKSLVFPIIIAVSCLLSIFSPAHAQRTINPENYEPNLSFEDKVNKVNGQCLPPEIDDIYTSRSEIFRADIESWYKQAGDTADFTLRASGELKRECGEKNITPYNAVKYGGLLLTYMGVAASGGTAAPAAMGIIAEYGTSELTEELLKCVSKSFINVSDMLPDAKKAAHDSVDALFAVNNLRSYKNSAKSLEWDSYTASMQNTVKALPDLSGGAGALGKVDQGKIEKASSMFSLLAGMVDRGVDIDAMSGYYDQAASDASDYLHVLADPQSMAFLRHANQALKSCRYDDVIKNLKFAKQETLKECKAVGQQYREQERLIRSYYYLYRKADLSVASAYRDTIESAYRVRGYREGAMDNRLQTFKDIEKLEKDLTSDKSEYQSVLNNYQGKLAKIRLDLTSEMICNALSELEDIFAQFSPQCQAEERSRHWEQIEKINMEHWNRAKDKSTKWWSRLDDIQEMINSCELDKARREIKALSTEIEEKPTYRLSSTGCEPIDQSPILDKLSSIMGHNKHTVDWCLEKLNASKECDENSVKLSDENGKLSCVPCSVIKKDMEHALSKGNDTYARSLVDMAPGCNLSTKKPDEEKPCAERTIEITENGKRQCVACASLQTKMDAKVKAGELQYARSLYERASECPLDGSQLSSAEQLQANQQRCDETLPGSQVVDFGGEIRCICPHSQAIINSINGQACHSCQDVCGMIDNALLNNDIDQLKALLKGAQACSECYERGVTALGEAEQSELQQELNQQCHEKIMFSIATPIGNDRYQCVCREGMVLMTRSGSSACQTCEYLLSLVQNEFDTPNPNTGRISGLIQGAQHCGWYNSAIQAIAETRKNQQQQLLNSLEGLTGAIMNEYDRQKKLKKQKRPPQVKKQPPKKQVTKKPPQKKKAAQKKPAPKKNTDGCAGGKCGHGHSLYCKNSNSSFTPYPRTALDINEDWRCDICNLPFMTKQGKLAPGVRGALRGNGYTHCSTSH